MTAPLIVRGRLFADHGESVLRHGAEVLHAKAERFIHDGHLRPEIDEVMAGEKQDRKPPGDVTVYKSLGSFVQDLVSGSYILQQIRKERVRPIIAVT